VQGEQIEKGWLELNSSQLSFPNLFSLFQLFTCGKGYAYTNWNPQNQAYQR